METSTPSDKDRSVEWFGISTRSNYERAVAKSLEGRQLQYFLPLYKCEVNRSSRGSQKEKVLFPGYLFCRFDKTARLPILMTPGVARIVSVGSEPAPIEAHEIEAIRSILKAGVAVEPCPYLQEGQRVVITKGPLKEMTGMLLRKKSEVRVIASISLLQRSVSVEVDSSWLSPQ
jgi:transcription antitermination factor NusG